MDLNCMPPLTDDVWSPQMDRGWLALTRDLQCVDIQGHNSTIRAIRACWWWRAWQQNRLTFRSLAFRAGRCRPSPSCRSVCSLSKRSPPWPQWFDRTSREWPLCMAIKLLWRLKLQRVFSSRIWAVARLTLKFCWLSECMRW